MLIVRSMSVKRRDCLCMVSVGFARLADRPVPYIGMFLLAGGIETRTFYVFGSGIRRVVEEPNVGELKCERL